MSLFRIDPDGDELLAYRKKDFMSTYLEKDLQDWLEKHPEVILDDEPLLIVGREVITDTGQSLDLLGIGRNGYPVIIELKATRTPRDVISQALDYAAWAGTLSDEELIDIADDYISQNTDYTEFRSAFNETFSGENMDLLQRLIEAGHFNDKRRLIIVAQGIDIRTRRMSKELDSNGYLVTLRSYSYYVHEHREYLNFNTVFSSIVTSVKLGASLQSLRDRTIKQNGSAELFDYLHSTLAEREDILLEVGSHSTIYKFRIDNKLKSIINLYPLKKDCNLGVHIYLKNLPESINKEEFLGRITKFTGLDRSLLLTESGKHASFGIEKKTQADEISKMIEEAIGAEVR